MSWTTPRTWVTDELVTASVMNAHLRDNLNALKSPPSAQYVCDEASDYVTTSQTFVSVDSTNLKKTITTHGGDVMVHFHGAAGNDSDGRLYFDIGIDLAGGGSRHAGNDGALVVYGGHLAPVSFVRLISSLSAGAHTFELMWRVEQGSGYLYAGAGTTAKDVHPQFWVREVS